MILEIDSTAVFTLLEKATRAALLFLPSDFQLFAPLITSAITALAAFIWRAIEKKRVIKQTREEEKKAQEARKRIEAERAALLIKVSELKQKLQ